MSFENNERIKALVEWGRKVPPPSSGAYFGGTKDWAEPIVRPATRAEILLASDENYGHSRITATFIRQIINEARYREAMAKNPEKSEHLDRLIEASLDYAIGFATMHSVDADYCDEYRDAVDAVALISVDADRVEGEQTKSYTELPQDPGRVFIPTTEMRQSWNDWRGI